jgi:CheY-like chemotaxis protein
LSVSKKAELTFDCPSGQPLVQGDPGQVRQLVMNLVTNASEALGEETGSVVVRTSAAEGTGTERRGLSIEVSDTGCGIPEQDRARIYEPFFTTKFTGRGLGLAAVHGIVRGHQGTIEVRSAVGRGTTFRVLFPALVESHPAAHDETPEEVESLATRTVLVVDDEDGVLSLAQAVLDEAGCEVLTAANGHEAISVYGERAEEIDVVVLDLSMPSLNGLETFRAMRTIRPDARVILSSGYGPVDLQEAGAGRPLAGYLEKPYTPDRLVDEVRRALRR